MCNPAANLKSPLRHSKHLRTRKRGRKARRGAVLVEFAVCLPVIVAIVFGTIEACEMVYLKRSVTQAAYEGARTAIVPSTSAAQAQAAVQQVLADRSISGTINFTPATVVAAPAGTYVAVDVTAAVQGNVYTSFFTSGSSVTAHVEMMKEF